MSDDSAVWDAVDRLREKVDAMAIRTNTHEAVCAERYLGIKNQIIDFKGLLERQSADNQRWNKYILIGLGTLGAADVFGLNHVVTALFEHFGLK